MNDNQILKQINEGKPNGFRGRGRQWKLWWDVVDDILKEKWGNLNSKRQRMNWCLDMVEKWVLYKDRKVYNLAEMTQFSWNE